jgi:hypothetical protein
MDNTEYILDQLAILIDQLDENKEHDKCRKLLRDYEILIKNRLQTKTTSTSTSTSTPTPMHNDLARQVALRQMYGLRPLPP